MANEPEKEYQISAICIGGKHHGRYVSILFGAEFVDINGERYTKRQGPSCYGFAPLSDDEVAQMLKDTIQAGFESWKADQSTPSTASKPQEQQPRGESYLARMYREHKESTEDDILNAEFIGDGDEGED